MDDKLVEEAEPTLAPPPKLLSRVLRRLGLVPSLLLAGAGETSSLVRSRRTLSTQRLPCSSRRSSRSKAFILKPTSRRLPKVSRS